MDKSRESWGSYGRFSYYIRKYNSVSEAFDQEVSCKRYIFVCLVLMQEGKQMKIVTWTS